MYVITTQKDLRRCFWERHHWLHKKSGWKQNNYPTDTRVAWCDYIENLQRNGDISEELAERATL